MAGRASIYGTGTNPGFANALGLFVTQLCRTVRHVSVTESVDASSTLGADLEEFFGLGRPAGDPEVHGMAERVTCVFQDALPAVMADGLGIELEEMVFSSEWAVTTADVDLGWWQIPHGHYCGLKATWSGRRGRPIMDRPQRRLDPGRLHGAGLDAAARLRGPGGRGAAGHRHGAAGRRARLADQRLRVHHRDAGDPRHPGGGGCSTRNPAGLGAICRSWPPAIG